MRSATLHTLKFLSAVTLLLFIITCSQRAPQEQAPSQKPFTPPTHAYKFDEEDGQWLMPAKNYASTGRRCPWGIAIVGF